MEKQIWDGVTEVHIQVVGAQVAQIVLHSMMNKIPLNSPLSLSMFCFVAASCLPKICQDSEISFLHVILLRWFLGDSPILISPTTLATPYTSLRQSISWSQHQLSKPAPNYLRFLHSGYIIVAAARQTELSTNTQNCEEIARWVPFAASLTSLSRVWTRLELKSVCRDQFLFFIRWDVQLTAIRDAGK